MDGSAGVDRGHEAKMEGDAHRKLERMQHKKKATDKAATPRSALCRCCKFTNSSNIK